MKSIEEMSIEDLLYRVRYSILPCYGQEILSRFAEKDKRIAELEKLPQIKYIYGLITKIAELEKQVADLRCCGNCVHYAYDMEEDHHYCDKHIYSGLRHQGICTNNWQSDNKTKAEREK